MHIGRIRIKNFLIHRDTQLELLPFTVFVGPNNGGKSAIAEALLNFSMASRGRLSEAFGTGPRDFSSIRHRGAPSTARVGYEVELKRSATDSESLSYSVSFSEKGRKDNRYYEIHEESIVRTSDARVLFKRGEEYGGVSDIGDDLADDVAIFAAVRRAHLAKGYVSAEPLIDYFAQEISRITTYRLEPDELRRPSQLPDLTTLDATQLRAPRISYGGANLAAVLYYLTETADPVLKPLRERIRSVIHGFDDFAFNAVTDNKIGFGATFSDSRGTVLATNLSSGTLSFIGLVTLLLSAERAPVVWLEEPENGLAPQAVEAVVDLAREAASPGAASRSQILMSSHSPFLLEYVWRDRAENLFQVKPEEGRALVARVDEVVPTGALRMEGGRRAALGLRNAELVMSGAL